MSSTKTFANKQLSAHFSWAEMTHTGKSELLESNRNEAKQFESNLTATAELMEKVREILGVAIKVNSGFRGATLNTAVGGSQTSQHMRGEACDFVPAGLSIQEAYRQLREAGEQGNLKWGQLLQEGTWIHISLGQGFREDQRCGQVGHKDKNGKVVIDGRVEAAV